MPVDFKKPAHILVVHGVQTGEDSSIKSEQQIRALLTRSLADIHVEKDFEVSAFLYENINDDAQHFYQLIGSAITKGKPLIGKALDTVIDLAGDVVTAAKNTSTAHKIRKGLRDKILESYRSKNQVVIVSHSLGTIYALDVVNELIANNNYFKGDDYNSWPVQGLITMGSPLGLGLEMAGIKIFEKRVINTIADAKFALFPWHNYYNRLDPVVSGNVFGTPVQIDGARGPVEMRYGPSIQGTNWLLQGHVVTSGQQWLLSHTAYWNNPTIADRIIDMLWG
jgi:hypothetical protein